MMGSPTRREVLQGFAALGMGTLVDCGRERTQAGTLRPPNMVVIVTDDMAWRAWGGGGAYPFFATPNIDRIAAEGASFANTFCTTALCSPSRASLLTGCYANRHGVTRNEVNDPDPTLSTYPQLLQAAGYETAFIGKWHMRPDNLPRPGFDYWNAFSGQGVYRNPTLNENGQETTVQGYTTDVLTDFAVAWLEKPRTAPFCMILSHKAPHEPFVPASGHADAFSDAEIPKPANFDDDYAGKPRWLRRATLWGEDAASWAASEGRAVPDTLPPATWDARDPTKLNYLRTILSVDDSAGRVLSALEEIGQLDDTLVVLTSDNGFMLGAHRREDKRLMYEESIRVPLLLRFPPLVDPGTIISATALTIDLAPTLLDLAGAAIPDVMQGASWLPLLSGDASAWRPAFLYEYFPEPWLPGIPRIQGVRTPDWKLMRYPEIADDVDELYDLTSDSLELNNLITDPAYADILAELTTLLDRLKPA